jgi:Rrf2 family protein
MRLQITRSSDLAMRALRLLETDGQLTAGALAQQLDSSPQFIPQVMNPLVRAGWVASESGPRGGYRLAGSLGDKSVLDLIELTEGPTDNGKCVLRQGPCSGQDTCSLHESWTEARKALTERLADLPISNHGRGT